MNSYDAILKEVKKGNVQPVYFLHGDEPFFLDELVAFFEGNILTEEEKAFNLIMLYGKDIDHKYIVDEARQYPLMASRRLVIVKEAQDLKTFNELQSYIEKPNPSTVLVLCYKHKKLDKRSKISKVLESRSVVFESKKIYDNQTAGWIKGFIHDKGHKISEVAAETLAAYIGPDLSRLSNEIDKILINQDKGKEIQVEEIKEQVGISKDFDVFELQKALGERNFGKANLIFRYFMQNPNANPSVLVLSSLYNYFNKVYIVQSHAGMNDQDLAKITGVSPFFLKEYRLAARKYSKNALHNIFSILKQADQSSKGIGARNTGDASIYKDLLIGCMYENTSVAQ
jgi:DNA polymerase-3 subunit delta